MRNVVTAGLVLLLGSIVGRAETAGESVLKELRELEAGAFRTAVSNWTRAKDPLAATFSGTPRSDEAKAGVVVYHRPWIVYTTARSAPSEAERVAAFVCEAAPGELEPISVSLYCLSDVSKIKGTISDLRGPGAIPASNVTVFGTTHGLCNADGDMLLVKKGREAKMLGPVLDRAKGAGFRSWVYFLMDRGFGNCVRGWWGVAEYPSKEYQAAYKKTVRALLKALKDAGYPEPILVANDEPTSNKYHTKRIFDEMKWIDQVGGRNYAVVHKKGDAARFAGKPHFHTWVSNNPSPAMLAAAEAGKCALATYRGGHWQRKVAEVRFHFGYKSFWFDAPLTFSWAHDWDYGAGSGINRFNDFAGGR